MSDDTWEVLAVKYADRQQRCRADSFVFDDAHDAPHPIDYFVWVIRNQRETIVVDTGYDEHEAQRRQRPILRNPVDALAAVGVQADAVQRVIITHLHYDHAGTLGAFPKAIFHLQAAEMQYATGPCMCESALQMPFTAAHVCDMVHRVYAGRVCFHDGDAELAPGLSVHRIGGHSRGLQAVRVRTASGYLCLASDAAHFYENFLQEKPFPIVVDVADMLSGFRTIQSLASHRDLVIPGHDPLVTQRFAPYGSEGFAWQLDGGPVNPLPG